MRHHNAIEASERLQEVFDWLTENGREAHFVNVYDNTDDQAGIGELIVVLNDRDTALMMKLALL